MKAVVQKLKTMSFKTATDGQIQATLNKIGPMGSLMFKMDKGRGIYRSVKIENGHKPYDTKGRISFNPNPGKYGRCNLPGGPTFYGSLTTHRQKEVEVHEKDREFNKSAHGYLINLFECSDLVMDLEAEGTESYVVGMWKVQQDFEVMQIIEGEPVEGVEAELIAEHARMLAEMDASQIKGLKVMNQYLSDEFSKPVDDGNEHEYKISANYANMALKKLPGLKYPSVKAKKEGFNIALSSDLVDQGLIALVRAVHIKIYKRKGDQVLFNWIGNAEFSDGEPFDFKPIPGVSLSDVQLREKLREMGMEHLF